MIQGAEGPCGSLRLQQSDPDGSAKFVEFKLHGC